MRDPGSRPKTDRAILAGSLRFGPFTKGSRALMTNPADRDPPGRLVLSSLDVTSGREAALRELFPEAFTDNRFDPSKIDPHLSVAPDKSPSAERYGLSWAGKANAMRAVQVLSTGTLHPNAG